MREVTDGVWHMPGLIPNFINTWLVRIPQGEMLVDTGIRWARGRILRQLRGRQLALVALTHVHPDHQGAAAAVCRRYRVPLACHDADAAVMEGKRRMAPDTLLVRLGHQFLSGSAHPVQVRWQGGEMLGEWQIIATPGHTPGHVIFFRQRDRVVISGDVVSNFRLPGFRLAEPPHFFSVDAQLNRQSIKLLADLRPSLVCPGHGPAWNDRGELAQLARKLLQTGEDTTARAIEAVSSPL